MGNGLGLGFGMPSINIIFETLAKTVIARSQKGTVAVLLRDTKLSGVYEYKNTLQLPSDISQENREHIRRIFLGYVNPPKKVICAVFDGTEKSMTYALAELALRHFDYLVGMPNITPEEAEEIKEWVLVERQKRHTVKAVLPNVKADYEGVVNFTTTGITVGDKKMTTAQYCARIAGILAGTPMNISATYAPLLEVTDIDRLTPEEEDEAVNDGEFILFHDGEKVKTGRAVNSFTSTSTTKTEAWQKIKIVEAIDMIQNDITRTAQDSFIGKYANSYDNKLLLVVAISEYLERLARDEIVKKGSVDVFIDPEAVERYLQDKGIDTEEMTEQSLKEADTGSRVFIRATAKILDAIEDIDLVVEV